MKNKTIMLKGKASMVTLEELWQRWTRRAFFLKKVMLDEAQPAKKRMKANILHTKITALLSELLSATIKATQINAGKFEPGGVVGQVHKGEVVISRRSN